MKIKSNDMPMGHISHRGWRGCLFSSLQKMHGYSFKQTSPKDALCQFWLKLVLWFWGRKWTCEKFTLTIMIEVQTTDICYWEKFGWAYKFTMHFINIAIICPCWKAWHFTSIPFTKGCFIQRKIFSSPSIYLFLFNVFFGGVVSVSICISVKNEIRAFRP